MFIIEKTLKGKISGIYNPKVCRVENKSVKQLEFSKIKFLFGDFIAIIRNNNDEYVYPSISAKYDFYYNMKNMKVSTNFFEILKESSELSWDVNSVTSFIKKGYFPPGKTYFNEIKRIPIGFMLNLKSFKLISIFNSSEGPTSYECFKNALINTIGYLEPSNDDFLLLSGGRDSNLMLSVIKFVYNRNPSLINFYYVNPALVDTENDKFKVEELSQFYNLKLHSVAGDFNKFEVDNYKFIFNKMPLSAHLSVGFVFMYREILDQILNKAEKPKVHKVWCGQNADSLYNLGPTAKRVSEYMMRYLMSEVFFSSLRDVRGSLKIPKNLIAKIIAKIVSSKYKTKYEVPKSKIDLVKSFLFGREYWNLLDNYTKENCNVEWINKLYNINTINDPYKMKQLLYDLKLASFVSGRDHRIVIAANSNDDIISPVLPYSSVSMINVFRNISLGFRDIIYPKRYINMMLKEILNDKYEEFKKIVSKKSPNDGVRLPKFEKHIMENTKFGFEIRSKILMNDLFKNINVRKLGLQQSISLLWISLLLNRIKYEGILIKGNNVLRNQIETLLQHR